MLVSEINLYSSFRGHKVTKTITYCISRGEATRGPRALMSKSQSNPTQKVRKVEEWGVSKFSWKFHEMCNDPFEAVQIWSDESLCKSCWSSAKWEKGSIKTQNWPGFKYSCSKFSNGKNTTHIANILLGQLFRPSICSNSTSTSKWSFFHVRWHLL